jgi:4-amino-4-deoxy-L-arabinose transferase-like glycosyltransferase
MNLKLYNLNIMNKKLLWTLLLAILILASVLRLWQLGLTPPSPDWDEVALGYNAYSLLHTGRDEFGKFLPVVLRSFDDYKPALYAYLTVPTVAVFGVSVFAVRLPSALFGVLSVLAVFFLIGELFENYKYKNHLSLISAIFLAISPWSIQFSRVGFEANVASALNILAVLFFLKGLKKPWFLFISVICAVLTVYTYQSEKVFAPLLVLALILIYHKKLFLIKKKYIISALIIGIIVAAPMLFYLVSDKSALLRLRGTSIFNYQTEILKSQVQDIQRDNTNNDKIGALLDNRRMVYAKTIIGGYLSHFDLNWLFIRGDIERHHAPNMGLIYLFELPLILFGIYLLLFGDFSKQTKLLIFGWLLLAPIPASITTGVPHAVRTLNFLPTWQILSALGLVSFLIWIKKQDLRHKIYDLRKLSYVLILISYILFTSVNIMYYLNQYFVQLNYYDSADWQYGYKQAVEEVEIIGDKYKEIIVSDRQPMDKSYMFFLFYLKYPPWDYQIIGAKSSGGYAEHHAFGKYTFRPIDWQNDSKLKNVLLIGTPDEIPGGASIKTINNLDGTPAIRIAGT